MFAVCQLSGVENVIEMGAKNNQEKKGDQVRKQPARVGLVFGLEVIDSHETSHRVLNSFFILCRKQRMKEYRTERYSIRTLQILVGSSLVETAPRRFLLCE